VVETFEILCRRSTSALFVQGGSPEIYRWMERDRRDGGREGEAASGQGGNEREGERERQAGGNEEGGKKRKPKSNMRFLNFEIFFFFF
jgi:hypothetical protein